jgi:S1-C subfamily serine protease
MRRFIFALLIMVVGFQGLFTGKLAADEEAHRLVRRSTVWIVNRDGSSGTAVLVDEDKGLVVTNAHVVGKNDVVAVFSHVQDTQGRTWDRKSYLAEAKRLESLGYATTGQVISYAASKDLAIVRLAQNLKNLQPITLATERPKKGDGLHVVGNPGGRPLFSYAFGGTREVRDIELTYTDGVYFKGEVIRFSSHIWAGNSGGPVTNEDGKLVGILSRGSTAMRTAIGLSEVRRLLDEVRLRQVFSVANPTDFKISYEVRLDSDGEWTSYTLEPGERQAWWPQGAENIEIRFTVNNQEKTTLLVERD